MNNKDYWYITILGLLLIGYLIVIAGSTKNIEEIRTKCAVELYDCKCFKNMVYWEGENAEYKSTTGQSLVFPNMDNDNSSVRNLSMGNLVQ